MESKVVIERPDLSPRGRGSYLRTANAADEPVSTDRCVAWRPERLPVEKRGRNQRAGPADRWHRTRSPQEVAGVACDGYRRVTAGARARARAEAPGAPAGAVSGADGVDETFGEVRAPGAEVLHGPASRPPGARDGAFR